MNRLVIIGNGFDLAHGLNTSYKDFVNWYWRERIKALITETSIFSVDNLCTLKMIDSGYGNWSYYMSHNYHFKKFSESTCNNSFELIEYFEKNPSLFEVKIVPFFNTICRNIENKGWVDIENEYYNQLKRCNPNDEKKIAVLNKQLQDLQNKLEEYLKTQNCQIPNQQIEKQIKSKIDINDISLEGKVNFLKDAYQIPEPERWQPDQTMLLSFNYTQTIDNYKGHNITTNYIHGVLSNPNSIIFGYGDDNDDDFKKLQKSNNNVLLDYIKSFRYLESDNYRQLLTFLNDSLFQVFLMGHSCGTSDCTLLNTIFEHENCVSIKPYYYAKGNGDNYRELVQNISRSFTSTKLLRDRVVNKSRCEALHQNS